MIRSKGRPAADRQRHLSGDLAESWLLAAAQTKTVKPWEVGLFAVHSNFFPISCPTRSFSKEKAANDAEKRITISGQTHFYGLLKKERKPVRFENDANRETLCQV